MSLYTITKDASLKVDAIEDFSYPRINLRTRYSVLTSTMSELGELAEEVMISEGNSYKEQGEDGIVGEAIDTILCLLDLLHKNCNLTEKELDAIAKKKCDKWVHKVQSRVQD